MCPVVGSTYLDDEDMVTWHFRRGVNVRHADVAGLCAGHAAACAAISALLFAYVLCLAGCVLDVVRICHCTNGVVQSVACYTQQGLI
jgi:hypothetical protein